jgi:serine/threonine protein kinase
MLQLLQYIHQNHVIHRDIKPQNIIRCQDDGRLVLIDFGAVKEPMAQLNETTGRTATTNFVGTIGFAPPEQFSLRAVYSSDIYALGVTCLYLLTGKAPLDFDSDRTTGEIYWQDSVQVSDAFTEILNKMIKISVRERFQSAGAILRSLNREFPQDNLAHCLTVQPPANSQGKNQQNPGSPNSPLNRTAIAIRDWKNRLHEHQRRSGSPRMKNTLSPSGSS